MAVPDFALSVRQLDRWFAGGVTTRPQPSICRVIEAEFRYPTEALLAPEDRMPFVTAGGSAGLKLDRKLRTIDFVSWIADHTKLTFGDIYVAVAQRADELANEPLSDRAAREHARAAVGRGQIAEALNRYYGAAACLYTMHVGDGPPASLSMLTKSEWIGLMVPMDTVHDTFNLMHDDDLQSADLTPTALTAAIGRLASVEVSDTVLLDNPLYRLLDIDIGSSRMSATLGLTTFAAYALTTDLLEAELIDSLADLPDHRPQQSLPLRDLYLPSATSALSFRQRLCAGGPVCLLALARADDYLLVTQERSPQVVNVAGRLSVIPKAFHQPLAEPQETALSATIERELEEELLGRQDLEQLSADAGRRAAPRHRRSISEPMNWLLEHRDSYQLSCTGFGVNMLSGNYEFAALAVIDDPTWWDSYGHQVEANWEANRLHCYSSRDTEGLARLIAGPKWSNEGLFAFVEGLRQLAQHDHSKTAIPAIEVVAG
jgi:hypothetical protein